MGLLVIVLVVSVAPFVLGLVLGRWGALPFAAAVSAESPGGRAGATARHGRSSMYRGLHRRGWSRI